jgi:glycyl-tRNA synthetase beta subunit
VFAKNADDALAGLVKQIDKKVAEQKDQKLAAVVNIVGDKSDELSEKIKAFVKKHDIQHTAVTISDEKNAGRFKVNPEAEVTVMQYTGKKVVVNHAIAVGGLDDKAIQAIVAGTDKVLK